jgi:hypothetical protein
MAGSPKENIGHVFNVYPDKLHLRSIGDKPTRVGFSEIVTGYWYLPLLALAGRTNRKIY